VAENTRINKTDRYPPTNTDPSERDRERDEEGERERGSQEVVGMGRLVRGIALGGHARMCYGE